MSHRAGYHYDSEQQDSPRQVTPILKFGNKVVEAKPRASLSCKSKFKIPTKPHQVIMEPGIHSEGKFVLPFSFIWVLLKKQTI